MSSPRLLTFTPLIVSKGFAFTVNGATYSPPSVGYFHVLPQYAEPFLMNRFQIPILLQILSGAKSAQGPYRACLTSTPLITESRIDARRSCDCPPSQQGHPGNYSRRHDLGRAASRFSGTFMPFELDRFNSHAQCAAPNASAWREYFPHLWTQCRLTPRWIALVLCRSQCRQLFV